MTEMEQLKKNADEQYVKERYDEVVEYIRKLSKEVDDLGVKSKKINAIELGLIAAQLIATVFAPDFVWAVFWVGWFFTMLHRVYNIDMPRRFKLGKMLGAIETLEILGIVTKTEDGNDRNTKPVKVRSLFKRFKEFWERMGSKNKVEVYGT